jgi:hypothetical protein
MSSSGPRLSAGPGAKSLLNFRPRDRADLAERLLRGRKELFSPLRMTFHWIRGGRFPTPGESNGAQKVRPAHVAIPTVNPRKQNADGRKGQREPGIGICIE